MKKIFVVFCLLGLLFVSCASAGNAGNSNQGFNSEVHGDLYIEKNAGFSMYIPKGWEIVDMNQKYLVAKGPLDNNFTPNIIFGDERYSGTISEYIDAVIAQISQAYAELQIIENESFTTNTGLQGRYITLTGRMNDIRVRQRLYLIQNKNKTELMAINGTAPFAGGEKYDALFDECVKTFNWKK